MLFIVNQWVFDYDTKGFIQTIRDIISRNRKAAIFYGNKKFLYEFSVDIPYFDDSNIWIISIDIISGGLHLTPVKPGQYHHYKYSSFLNTKPSEEKPKLPAIASSEPHSIKGFKPIIGKLY